MLFYSPLRYPGGKNKLAKFIAKICVDNKIRGHYVEPYAGGASVALFLLFNKYVKEITINDIDRSIYAFWHSVLNHSNELCKLIKNTDITVENWKANKAIQKNKNNAPLLELGFSTLFLNRTNISGVMKGGIIGGLEQKGVYKIDCRFNKKEIIKKIRAISRKKDKIHLHNIDALDLVKEIQKKAKRSQIIYYFDPPYYLKGGSLYVNYYRPEDHKKISAAIKKIKNSRWIVSYDNVPQIKKLYKNFNKIEYSFFHTAHRARQGKEVLFFDDSLVVSKVESPVKI